MPVNVVEDVEKDPEAELWYGFDLRVHGWLASADTIASAAWTITEESGTEETPDLEEDDAEIWADDTQAIIRLVGGTVGLKYLVRGKWTATPSGDVDARTFRVICVSR